MKEKYGFIVTVAALLLGTVWLSWPTTAYSASHAHQAHQSAPAEFLVGFAKQDITPTQLPFNYLGGDGYQRVGTSVLNPLWIRAVAIAPAAHNGTAVGAPIVIVSVDSQGYFLAYQAGVGGLGVADHGFAQIRAAVAKASHIPPDNVLFSSTHTHTAPDTLGVWGGSPTNYFLLVRRQAIAAATEAIASMQPASLWRGTADGSAYVYNFLPPNSVATTDHSVWPVYSQLTVLQARAWKTNTPIVTLVNFGVHPDILENTNYISPDWPAWMISTVTSAESGHTLFLQGTLGSEPVLPATSTHPAEYSGISGNPAASVTEAEEYGEVVAKLALSAVQHSVPLRSNTVRASSVPIAIPATNGLLFANNIGTLPPSIQSAEGVGHIERADVPPYLTGNVVGSVVSVLRIGHGALLAMPGEVFADVFSAAVRQIGAGWFVPVGLADDQLGYVVMPAEWPVAEAAGGAMGPAAEFSLGPETGSAIVQGLLAGARDVGFRVHLDPAALVRSDDPVVEQMQQCITLGFCIENNTP